MLEVEAERSRRFFRRGMSRLLAEIFHDHLRILHEEDVAKATLARINRLIGALVPFFLRSCRGERPECSR
jgi:uncharacterized membrane-anchored protein